MKQELSNVFLFTAKEVASVLGISEAEVKRKRAAGEIGCYKFGYKTYRFSRQHIDDFLQSVEVS